MRVPILLSVVVLGASFTVPVIAEELPTPAPGVTEVRGSYDSKAGVAGVRVGFTRTDGEQGTSLQFAGRGETFDNRGLLSTHATHFFAIGGGSAGFDGGMGLLLGFGPRIPVAPNHGPFVRVGGRGYLQGNRALYSSLLELPRGELGWQYTRGWTVLEAGASYGAVLTGRFRPNDADAAFLGAGFAAGGYAALQVTNLRAGFLAERLPRKDGGRIDVADAFLCAMGGRLALCGDMSWSRGDVTHAGSLQPIASWYGGVTLGFLPVTAESRPRPRTP